MLRVTLREMSHVYEDSHSINALQGALELIRRVSTVSRTMRALRDVLPFSDLRPTVRNYRRPHQLPIEAREVVSQCSRLAQASNDDGSSEGWIHEA